MATGDLHKNFVPVGLAVPEICLRRERQTDRQTDKQTERQTERQTSEQANRRTEEDGKSR